MIFIICCCAEECLSFLDDVAELGRYRPSYSHPRLTLPLYLPVPTIVIGGPLLYFGGGHRSLQAHFLIPWSARDWPIER